MTDRNIIRTTPILALALVAAGAFACGGSEEELREQGIIVDEPDAGFQPGQGNDLDGEVDDEDLEDPFDPNQEDEEEPVDEEDPIEEDEPSFDPHVAPFDNDSLQNPAVSETLRITGLRRLEYIDQISEEVGDNDDFVEFELPNNSNPSSRIQMRLDCEFEPAQNDGQVRATIYEDGEIDPGLMVLCNEGEQNLTVDNTKVQTVRIHFGITPDAQTLVTYHLTVIGFR